MNTELLNRYISIENKVYARIIDGCSKLNNSPSKIDIKEWVKENL